MSSHEQDLSEREMAVKLNQRTWELMEKKNKTPAEMEEMIHCAHASLLHWSRVGQAVNLQRGNWLLSRVYAHLGLAERALHYAKICKEQTEANLEAMEDFDRFYAEEALARSFAIAGNETAARHYAAAKRILKQIKDPEDLKICTADLASEPWGTFHAQ